MLVNDEGDIFDREILIRLEDGKPIEDLLNQALNIDNVDQGHVSDS